MYPLISGIGHSTKLSSEFSISFNEFPVSFEFLVELEVSRATVG